MFMNTLAKFATLRHFHVYNRTNNRELLFLTDENRRYFLQRLQYFCCDFVKFYSYCLLPNHYHFSISVRSLEEIVENLNKYEKHMITKTQKKFLESSDKERLIHNLVSTQFLRFSTSYSKSFNKFHGRKGNLFNRQFKRSLINTESKLIFLQYYIIHNARKHGVDRNFKDYKWNSYSDIISGQSMWLETDYLLDLFGGKSDFIAFMESEQNSQDYLGLDLE